MKQKRWLNGSVIIKEPHVNHEGFDIVVLDSSPHKDCFHFHRSHLFKPINQPRECTQSNVTMCWESGEVKYELILIHFILGIRLRPSPVMSACPPPKKHSNHSYG